MHSPDTLPHQLDLDLLCCRAIVETPAASRAKYSFDRESGMYKLSAMLPAGMAFPLDFGFVPSTRGEDGDPLDILLLAEGTAPLAVGCLVEARLLGVIEAEQSEGKETVRNDRLIARLAESRAFANIENLDQLGRCFCDELEQFFVTYNSLKERGFRILEVGGPKRAAKLIKDSSR